MSYLDDDLTFEESATWYKNSNKVEKSANVNVLCSFPSCIVHPGRSFNALYI